MSELAIKRIIEARVSRGWTQSHMARLIARMLDSGYSLRQYQKIEAGEFPKYKKIVVKAIEEILEIKISDLIYENKLNEDSSTYRIKDSEQQRNLRYDGLVYVSADAQSKYPARCNEFRYISYLPKVILPGIDQQEEQYRIFEVAGDDMKPYYEHGDYLLCERANNRFTNLIREFNPYIIIRQKDIVFAWIAISDDGNYIVLNKTLDRKILSTSDVQELWLVKKVMQWQDPIVKKFSTA